MTTLYELTTDLQRVADLDLDEQTLADTLEGITGEIQIKAENLIKVVENMDADVTAISNEIKRLTDRKKSIENRQKSLREYLRSNMQAGGISKISCPLFTITLSKGRPMVVVTDEDAIPDEYQVVTKRVDKRALLDALKAGLEVPGAELGESEEALRIR